MTSKERWKRVAIAVHADALTALNLTVKARTDSERELAVKQAQAVLHKARRLNEQWSGGER